MLLNDQGAQPVACDDVEKRKKKQSMATLSRLCYGIAIHNTDRALPSLYIIKFPYDVNLSVMYN